MQVDFYHLAASPVERVLRSIAEKVVAEGGRLLIVTSDEAAAARFDSYFWTYAPDSFLPHGRAGQGGEEAQPVLIAALPEPHNGARQIALADGLWRDEALDFDRAFHFFDDAAIGEARAAWKGLAGREGIERRFWKQEEGRWTQIA